MSEVKVLVVDDDDAVRSVTSEMLRRTGFEVVGAASGQEALELFDPQRFGLVMLDVGMPGMSGVEVYEQLRTQAPEQKILFITGYSEDKSLDLEHPHTQMLSKPFTIKVFTETLQNFL